MIKDAKEELVKYCNEEYPEHRQYITKDTGEVCIIMLQPPDKYNLWDWFIVDYNSWYPGEINTYKISMPVRRQ